MKFRAAGIITNC